MNADDLKETVLSQYRTSPVISGLIQMMHDHLDPSATIAEFVEQVMDITTATTWGLDNWGRILGISRLIEVEPDGAVFGFSGSDGQPFDQGPFKYPTSTNMYRLSDEAYRSLLMLKAAANISDCSIPSLNMILQRMLSGRGPAYVLDVGPMRIRYSFEYFLEPFERALMRNTTVPPKPDGVGYEVYEAEPANTFGFAGSDGQPFGHGTFSTGGPIHGY